MANEITKTESFQDVVRDRVRKVMMDAIPDEAIDGMIKKEFESFFEDGKDGYNRDRKSEFRQMVGAEVRKRLQNKVATYIDVNFETVWDSEGNQKLVGEAVEEFTPLAVQAIGKELVSWAMGRFREQLNQSGF